MKKLILLFILIVSTGLLAQNNGAIQANVIDLESFNEPLLMADVQLKDTPFKTKTNLNGNFEFEAVEPGAYTMVISFLGYKTVELPVEVKANNTSRIEQGLSAQTLSMGDITALISEKDENNTSTASIEKGNKE